LQVIHGVDIDIADGEFVVLVGPSGCGKSTLLRMIAGLETISGGEVSIGGRMVNDVLPKDRDIAMVFQSYALYPTMTVKENMAFGMESRGVPKAEQEAAIARVASLLQIESFLKRKPGQLSGGQRQRVAMGRALVRDPALFLFDEPLSNLDAKLRVDMRTEMKKLHHRVGKTTVYVTHDQIEAMTLASRIAVMHQGEVQQFDEPDTIYNRPANIFVAGFMGSPSMNFINAEFSTTAGVSSVTFPLADGNMASLPLHNGVAQRATDKKVVLGIRPEHLSRQSANTTGKPGIATLSAPVEVVEPTGAETMAVLKFGDREVVGRFSPDEAPKMGENMPLAIDMTRACLFDPGTQRLI
ncbi:MAG: transporter related protein, partial [Devosia sp.]|uniref:ABC transporter ATP-binding protein n=1 Tax=Devosia sp. TaxID=1871048 RepID=UPI00262DA0DE